MNHLTVRNIPDALARALEREKKRRGTSLNQTVMDLLSQGLGVGHATARRNGLAELAGRWTEEEQARFDEAVVPLESVDEDPRW